MGDIDCGIGVADMDIRGGVAIIRRDCIQSSNVLSKKTFKFILGKVNHISRRVLKERLCSIGGGELIEA